MEILSELKKNSQPHVVQYLDAFVADNPGHPRYYCSVMKFLSTLKKYQLNGDGVEIAVRLACDFLPLLQSFMEKEILHRDIKPENIFYDGDFRNDTGFLLGDFGIAKRDTETSVTPTGTETTMAPEVRGLDRSVPLSQSGGIPFQQGAHRQNAARQKALSRAALRLQALEGARTEGDQLRPAGQV